MLNQQIPEETESPSKTPALGPFVRFVQSGKHRRQYVVHVNVKCGIYFDFVQVAIVEMQSKVSSIVRIFNFATRERGGEG